MTSIEFLVEERSMEIVLREIVPRIVGPTLCDVHAFQGKPDLLRSLQSRLEGLSYAAEYGVRIVVVVDRDNDDCVALKQVMEDHARQVGLATRTNRRCGQYTVTNRIAVEELESWYFGDWRAVRSAYPGVSERVPRQARFRDPDHIRGGTAEAFERILKRAGYFRGGLRKLEAARQIAPFMDPSRNTSHSFALLRDALSELVYCS